MATPKKRRKIFDLFYKKGEAGGMDLVFMILIFCLLGFGLVMVASSSYVSALHNEGDSYYFIKRQMLWAAAGVAGMFFVSRLNYNAIRCYIPWIYGLAVVLLGAVLVPGIGLKINGARRWLNLGIATFQPSELGKLAIILLFAAYIAANHNEMKKFKVGILWPGLALVLICLLVAVETHLSAAVLIFLVGVVMLVVGGISLKWFFGVGITGTAALATLAFSIPYTRERIMTMFNPEADPTGSGFQTLQSLYAIGSGGLLGLGLGQSRQKYLYIPEPQNDYIFSIVCEELGFIGAMMVIILFVLLIWRGFVIAFHAKDKFGSLIVVGIVSRVAIQTILNIGVVTNTIPPTGISLPFFSYGGTALLMLMIEMGLVLSISRQSRMEVVKE